MTEIDSFEFRVEIMMRFLENEIFLTSDSRVRVCGES